MYIEIITCIPEILEGSMTSSILNRAQNKKKVTIQIHNLRDYSTNKHKKVDDRPYGGSAGMILQIEPIVNCIENLKKHRKYEEVIYMSPDGNLLTQKLSNRLSLSSNLIVLCGHYKGIDERIRQHFITLEISIGEYVITGGELAAAVLVDSVVRLIPGVLSDEESMLTDSFQDNLIGSPEYTRPRNFRGLEVPDILLSGNLIKIMKWREKESIKRTKTRNSLFHDKK